jgi:hypothetical protein
VRFVHDWLELDFFCHLTNHGLNEGVAVETLLYLMFSALLNLLCSLLLLKNVMH